MTDQQPVAPTCADPTRCASCEKLCSGAQYVPQPEEPVWRVEYLHAKSNEDSDVWVIFENDEAIADSCSEAVAYRILSALRDHEAVEALSRDGLKGWLQTTLQIAREVLSKYKEN